jgi:hypothetical protein
MFANAGPEFDALSSAPDELARRLMALFELPWFAKIGDHAAAHQTASAREGFAT